MMKNKLGFTLIELLAVVVIVAVLTSVAVPQYRKSIRRAEAMEALVNLRSIFDAAKRYKSANSAAPTQLKGLDVEFFDATSNTASTFSIGQFSYTFANTKISACRSTWYCFDLYYNHANKGKDALVCRVVDSNKTGQWLCESLGSSAAEDRTGLASSEYLLP